MTAPQRTDLQTDGIGLAVVGCGAIGRIRAVLAREYPGVRWLGLCDIDEAAAEAARRRHRRRLHHHRHRRAAGAPGGECGHHRHRRARARRPDAERRSSAAFRLFIEKPLATDPVESARVLAAIDEAGVDAVVGYTQRFRRRFLTVKQRLRDGQIGEVTTVVTRAFMNRMVPDATLRKVSGHHQPHPDGGLGHPQPRHVHVAAGGQGPRSRSTPARPTTSLGADGHQGRHLRRLHHGRRHRVLA